MNFLELILTPFIFIIQQLFKFGYFLTQNYGLAIIFLSFSISLLLLPIFILIEKSKKKDDVRKLKMKPLIDEIKRCYKGQERYYYIKTLNRQHHYSPIRALIPILSLLLQIPFFIAAYQFLEGLEPLAGVSFLFINDLSAPDALFGALNALPIAMTLVNLLTAYFYTRYGDSSERKQMLVVAGIFLVLLFKLPSGLVLYWTMNNVFSFLRLFITNREVFRKAEKQEKPKAILFTDLKFKFKLLLPKLKLAFLVFSILAIILQINWAFQNDFDTIWIRLGISLAASFVFVLAAAFIHYVFAINQHLIAKIELKPAIFFSLLFFSAYFHLAARYYFTGINNTLNIFAVITLLPLQFIGLIYFARIRNKRNKVVNQLITFLLLFVLIIQVFTLYNLYVGDDILLEFLNITFSIKESTFSNFITIGIIFSLLTLPFYWKFHQIKLPILQGKAHWLIFSMSAFYITGFLFLWHPLIVFSSSPESFNFLASSILKTNFNLFAISFVICIVLYALLKPKTRGFILVLLLSVTIIGFINSSIIPINMGTLQMGRFSNANHLAAPFTLYIFEAFFILVTLHLINHILKKEYHKQIIIGLLVLNLIPIIQSLLLSIMPEQLSKNKVSLPDPNYAKSISLNTPHTISFSKNDKNVVYIMADMFQGWYIRKILEDVPKLKESFEGFVWYPNTVSVSNYTASSMPSLLAGYNYTPDMLDKDTLHTLGEKMVFANQVFRDKAKSSGFHFTSTNVPYSNMDKNTIDTYIPFWHSDWDYLKNTLNIGNAKELNYKILWENAAFFCVPLFVKPKIYNNGTWLFKDNGTNENTNLSIDYNFLRALPYVSDNKSEEPNLILICSKASHFPWDMVTDDGTLVKDVKPYKNNTWTITKIAEWIDWMKLNGVYDNTKIIIVSDHGIRDTEINDSIMVENPFIPKIADNIPLKELLYYTPLLMVKNYNSKGLIKEDRRFMCNADASLITFDENDPTKINPPLTRTFNAFYISWRIKVYENKQYPIDKSYKVKENVYEIKNWTILKK